LKSSEHGGPIDVVAREMGIRASAIRYYEQQGLLPPLRRSGGRRELDGQSVARLKLIAEARKLGFGIQELRELCRSGRSEWRNQSEALVERIRAEIGELSRRLERLTSFSNCRCQSEQDCVVR
jgi:MerR family redox-sensitive transcriptional activator SoxR